MGPLLTYEIAAQPIEKSKIELNGTILKPSSSSERSKCEILLSQASAIKQDPTHIDFKLRDKWLKSQRNIPESISRFLKWLSDKIEIVSTQDIQDNLASSFERFQTENQHRPVVFLVTEQGQKEVNKSGAWLTGFIQKRFPEFRESPTLAVGLNPNAKAIEYLSKHPEAQFVAVDDVAYSGTQLSRLVEDATNYWKISPDRIHIVVGYSTRRATTLFQSTPINFISSGQLDNIGSLIAKEPEIIRDDLQRAIELFKQYSPNENLEEFSLAIPDYKSPDSWSFPSFLIEGYVFELTSSGNRFKYRENPWGTAMKIPFIQDSMPPYKQVPYLDPQTDFNP